MQNKLTDFIFSFSGKFTMYRSMVYFLGFLLGATMLFGALDILPYSGLAIFVQTVSFVVVCWGINTAIARFLKIPANSESSIITALILASIVGPLDLPSQWMPLVLISFVAIVSKYIIVVNKGHIFNPAALGVVASALLIGTPASWWIGSYFTLPIILAGGLFMAMKIKRTRLIASFLVVYGGLLIVYALLTGGDIVGLKNILTSASFLFFVFIMLTEPLTSPRTEKARMGFGVFTGAVLFCLQTFMPYLPYSLELSLLAGNMFTVVISPGFRQLLVLRKRDKLSSSIEGFWLEPERDFSFKPGQFIEYTLAHSKPDSRGVRRFFTIASSPSEKDVLLVSKFYEKGSSFKKALYKMSIGDDIAASGIGGDFVLPKDKNKKLVFIAGGIGITPFRSMIKYLMDNDEKKDIILLYSARDKKDLVFKELFEEATEKIGLKNVYVVSENEKDIETQNMYAGYIDSRLIEKEVSDLKERTFFISGPEAMVRDMERLLARLGVPKTNIKRDYFPGY